MLLALQLVCGLKNLIIWLQQPNFIIVPLSFLSGTFYSIERLPLILQDVSRWNPFFYIIDGFRYGFLGASDGSLKFGISYLVILSCLTWYVAFILYKKGIKLNLN